MLLLLLVLACAWLGAAQSRRVLLSGVSSLSFRAGKMTTFRRTKRTKAVAQLTCTSNCDLAQVSEVTCANAGLDSKGEVRWQCRASALPVGVSLTDTTVNCEGFEYPEDAHVTEGSCGLEFALANVSPYRSRASDESTGGAGLLALLAFAAVAYIVYRTCWKHRPSAAAAPAARPPPPRNDHDDHHHNNDGNYGDDRFYQQPDYMDPGMGMGGFWGGLGLGTLGGYFMGPRRNYGFGTGFNNYNVGYGLTRQPGFQPTINTGGWTYGSGIGGYTPGPGFAGGGDEPPPRQEPAATRRR